MLHPPWDEISTGKQAAHIWSEGLLPREITV